MKKTLFFWAVIAVLSGAQVSVYAAEERMDHYEGKEIESAEQAVQELREENARISEILQSDELDVVALEEIHEISYSLETAIDRLIKDRAGASEQLEKIDEAIQAVHYASENHEETKVREWFAKLEKTVEVLDVQVEAHEHVKVEDGVYEIVIKDHKFTPDEIHVPAHQKIKLVVHNQDPTPEEFESDDFRREKIIAGNSKATIFVGPLKPGKYHFFGEFNLDSANGYLIAK